jgi:hypothetical protein
MKQKTIKSRADEIVKFFYQMPNPEQSVWLDAWLLAFRQIISTRHAPPLPDPLTPRPWVN